MSRTLLDDLITELIERRFIDSDTRSTLNLDKEPARLVKTLIDHGVDHAGLAGVMGKVMNMPVLDPMETPAIKHRGSDFVIANGCCYVVNPLDQVRLKDIQKQYRDSIRKWGVLPFGALDNLRLEGGEIDAGTISEEDEKNAVETFEAIIEEAVARSATDIHFIPNGDTVLVRARIDGKLRTVRSLKLNSSYNALANVMLERSGNQGGVYLRPVDGEFSWSIGHRSIRIRLSMVPVKDEIRPDAIPRFALRLLGLELQLSDIDRLGLLQEHIEALEEISRLPHGLFLVTGPVGSGKTTTLLAMMRRLLKERPEDAFHTVEDPVEVILPNVSQIQINVDAGVTFPTALRALVRQDTNNIMVGEIRDLETMNLAVEAALTGRFVMASLHANSALMAIPRLMKMGAEPDILADVLAATSAQRIVQKVCQDCAQETSLRAELDRYRIPHHAFVGMDIDMPVQRANRSGCPKCNGGYSKRCAIAELLRMDRRMARMIAEHVNIQDIEQYAVKCGFHGMWVHAKERLARGEVDLDTLVHVLGPPQTFLNTETIHETEKRRAVQ